jgi:cytidylate kinase
VTHLIVTVDGPAGTGKSTVSRAVATLLEVPHLDTGAFYRAAALAAIRTGVDPHHEAEVVDVLADVSFDQSEGVMLLDGENISMEIRSPEVTAVSSVVSAHPGVRALLVREQRAWVERHQHRAVVEGRDIGSVVFPDATLKVYLDARPEVRARRRARQTGDDYATILAEIEKRDHRDTTREASPLTVPDGAVSVDTSDMSFDEVVDEVVRLARSRSG